MIFFNSVIDLIKIKTVFPFQKKRKRTEVSNFWKSNGRRYLNGAQQIMSEIFFLGIRRFWLLLHIEHISVPLDSILLNFISSCSTNPVNILFFLHISYFGVESEKTCIEIFCIHLFCSLRFLINKKKQVNLWTLSSRRSYGITLIGTYINHQLMFENYYCQNFSADYSFFILDSVKYTIQPWKSAWIVKLRKATDKTPHWALALKQRWILTNPKSSICD